MDSSPKKTDTNDPYMYDSIEFFVDPENEKLGVFGTYGGQIVKAYGDPKLWVSKPALANGTWHGSREIDGGYTVTLSLLWTTLGLTPSDGLIIGFDLTNNDTLSGTTRSAALTWSGDSGNYLSTKNYGNLVLTGEAPVVIDTSRLEAAIAQARAINPNIWTLASLNALSAAIENGYAVLENMEPDQEDVDQAVIELQKAMDGLKPATFTCAVKSMLAKVAKPQMIPYTWDGAPSLLTFSTSNPAICNVTPDGALVPLKAGTAVITITVPNGTKYLFTITVTA